MRKRRKKSHNQVWFRKTGKQKQKRKKMRNILLQWEKIYQSKNQVIKMEIK